MPREWSGSVEPMAGDQWDPHEWCPQKIWERAGSPDWDGGIEHYAISIGAWSIASNGIYLFVALALYFLPIRVIREANSRLEETARAKGTTVAPDEADDGHVPVSISTTETSLLFQGRVPMRRERLHEWMNPWGWAPVIENLIMISFLSSLWHACDEGFFSTCQVMGWNALQRIDVWFAHNAIVQLCLAPWRLTLPHLYWIMRWVTSLSLAAVCLLSEANFTVSVVYVGWSVLAVIVHRWYIGTTPHRRAVLFLLFMALALGALGVLCKHFGEQDLPEDCPRWLGTGAERFHRSFMHGWWHVLTGIGGIFIACALALDLKDVLQQSSGTPVQ